MTSNIEDYAIIGNCQTAALVGRDLSIDWLCWPRFDSAACFANLVGTRDNGRWSLAPDDDAADMYLAAMDRLDTAGYAQYEISNVAKPGRESRHNLMLLSRRE